MRWVCTPYSSCSSTYTITRAFLEIVLLEYSEMFFHSALHFVPVRPACCYAQCTHASSSVVPEPLPDYILQLWRKIVFPRGGLGM